MAGPAAPIIGFVIIAGKIYKVAKSPTAQRLAKDAIKKGAEKLNQLGLWSKPSGSLTREIVKNMVKAKDVAKSSRAKGKSPTVKPPKLSGGTKKGQGRTRKGSETKAPKSGGASKEMRSRRGSTSKSKAPEVTTTAPKSGGSSKVTSRKGSGFKVGPKTATVAVGATLGAPLLYSAIKKGKSPTIIKDGGPSRSGGASKDMRSRRGSTSVRIKIDPKAVSAKGNVTKVFKVTDGSPNKIDIGKTNFNVPRSIAAAKERGSKYFYDKNGVKKLAVTAEDLKKSGKSLREWANTFAPKKQSKLDTTAFTRTVAAMGK